MTARVYILGSGQDGGLPQFAARTEPNLNAHADASRQRLGPSICVLDDDGRCFLIDVSPDIKQQEARLLELPAYKSRPPGNPFDALLLTHAHMGHYAGLVHFGREAANTRDLPVYVTPKMSEFLATNAPWDQLVSLGNIRLENADATITPWDGLTVRTFLVPHRGEYTDTLGISINGTLLYVPDIDGWAQWADARAEVERHAVCLLDATFWDAGELPNRNLSEISHPFVTDTLEFFGDLAHGRRIVLTHLNHSNPLCDPDSAEAETARSAGFEIAHEMMVFEV